MACCSTPHVSPGASPYFLMFVREMPTPLSELTNADANATADDIRNRDWKNKVKGKEERKADRKRRAVKSDLEIGDEVLLKQEKTSKLTN